MNKVISIMALFCASMALLPQSDGYHVFMLTNHCPFVVWPALSGNAGSEHFNIHGIKLAPKHGTGMPVPNAWSGRIWARTNCNGTEGHNCETGNCGADNNCQKWGPSTAATVAYFSLDSIHNQDYYQISLVYGYNIPIEIEPMNHPNSTYNALGDRCVSTACKHDLNHHCPEHLALKSIALEHHQEKFKNHQNTTQTTTTANHHEIVGCKSPCQAHNTDEYCCRGSHRLESACSSAHWPIDYAKTFHQSCPDAKAYSRDSTTVPHYCTTHSVRFNINFCSKA